MIRRLITPFAALILTVSVALSPGCNKNPAGPSNVNLVIAFGDSITFGFGTNGDNGYVSVLSRRVGVNILNSGFPGDTTGSALDRIDGSVISRNPDVVIVFLGGNDFLRNVPVPERISNITAIVQRIRGSGAAVLLVGVASVPLDPFDGALPALASSTGSTYVPAILDGILGNPPLMFDTIHPNNAGHALIADRLEPSLRAVLAAIPQ